MRDFNSEHSNSYIMHKLTDLFFLTTLFTKCNILASFLLQFLANIEGYIPTRFSNGARVQCPAPQSMEGSFSWQMGDKLFWVTLLGDCSRWRVNG